VFVRDLYMTKSEVAEFFTRHYRDGNHRLRHLLAYPEPSHVVMVARQDLSVTTS
jgi:hypothetical protein